MPNGERTEPKKMKCQKAHWPFRIQSGRDRRLEQAAERFAAIIVAWFFLVAAPVALAQETHAVRVVGTSSPSKVVSCANRRAVSSIRWLTEPLLDLGDVGLLRECVVCGRGATTDATQKAVHFGTQRCHFRSYRHYISVVDSLKAIGEAEQYKSGLHYRILSETYLQVSR
jgi:hypothetical protein